MIQRELDRQYILSLSYGKDSIACLEAISQLGYPLDKCVHSEVWATENISADLPEMVEFKEKADEIIKKRYGVEVERVYATYKDGSKKTFEDVFYTVKKGGTTNKGKIYGWPYLVGASWCLDRLKMNVSENKSNRITYLGIASDETKRIAKQTNDVVLPLVDIGWDEKYCYDWCKENGLLSPIYESQMRGGCWFCHKQPINSLRLIYKQYPEYWDMMLKWDVDSPGTFKSDGHTLHDFDKRFRAEDLKLVPSDRKFKWKMIEGIKF